MSLGATLLQPQMLSRMRGRSPAEELGDEAMALLHKLVLDGDTLHALEPALLAAGEALGTRLSARVRDKLPRGLASLVALFQPLIGGFTQLGASVASPTELMARIATALDALAGATESLSDEAIRALVRRVAGIARDDFGLDSAVLIAELKQFLADFRHGIAAAPATAGQGSDATRHALACLLLRVERELLPLLPAFGFDADRIATLLIAELRRTGLAELRDKAQCLLGKVAAVLRALADAVRLMSAEVGVSRAMPKRPVRAAARRPARRDTPTAAPPRSDDGQYCWYASWLYATRFQGFGGEPAAGIAFLQTICPGYPEDEVWLSSDRKTLTLRRAHGDDEVLHHAETPFEWHQAPQFSGSAPARPTKGSDHAEYFVFPRIGAPFLETWAQVTALLVDVAAGMWHVVEMATSPREYAVNIPLWLWNWGRAITASIGKAPLPSLIAQKAGMGMGGKYLFSPLVAMLTVILGSLEGHHSRTNSSKNVFLQYLTMLGGDALNAFTIHTVTQAVRSLSLSVFTLINYEGLGQKPENGPDPRPNNWDMAGPVIGLINTLVGMAVFKLVRREDHGLPIGGNPTPFLLWFFLGAPIGAFIGGFCGTLIGWAVSRTVTPAQLWKEPVKAAIIGLLAFLVQLYMAKEGDTDDGRYNPTVDPQGDPNGRQPFAGYAENAATSPYRLPLPAGATTFVGQANQGFFSHMRYGFVVQVYAYDFAHDFKDEILAVRDGTVVDWFDFYPDDTELDLSGGSAADTATGQAAANAGQRAGLITAGQSGFDTTITPTGGGGSANLTGNWNTVMIRHDTVDNDHDRDMNGTVVVTFAEYGHGANGGVRAAFALRGIAPNNIIGTRVRQGEVVMLAGDSGTSFHNHLHLHVRPALPGTPVPPATPAPTFAPILPTTLAKYTVPFIFREGRHVLGRDGPLRHLTWYTSENTRLG